MHLLGATQVADLLGVTRQRVQQLAKEPGFPVPVATLGARKFWAREDVEKWARAQGRFLRNED